MQGLIVGQLPTTSEEYHLDRPRSPSKCNSDALSRFGGAPTVMRNTLLLRNTNQRTKLVFCGVRELPPRLCLELKVYDFGEDSRGVLALS
jgi:hypothetical protein